MLISTFNSDPEDYSEFNLKHLWNSSAYHNCAIGQTIPLLYQKIIEGNIINLYDRKILDRDPLQKNLVGSIISPSVLKFNIKSLNNEIKDNYMNWRDFDPIIFSNYNILEVKAKNCPFKKQKNNEGLFKVHINDPSNSSEKVDDSLLDSIYSFPMEDEKIIQDESLIKDFSKMGSTRSLDDTFTQIPVIKVIDAINWMDAIEIHSGSCVKFIEDDDSIQRIFKKLKDITREILENEILSEISQSGVLQDELGPKNLLKNYTEYLCSDILRIHNVLVRKLLAYELKNYSGNIHKLSCVLPFQKATLLMSIEIVAFLHNIESIHLAKLIKVLKISYFEVWKVINKYIASAEDSIPLIIKDHLQKLETDILRCNIFNGDSEMWNEERTRGRHSHNNANQIVVAVFIYDIIGRQEIHYTSCSNHNPRLKKA